MCLLSYFVCPKNKARLDSLPFLGSRIGNYGKRQHGPLVDRGNSPKAAMLWPCWAHELTIQCDTSRKLVTTITRHFFFYILTVTVTVTVAAQFTWPSIIVKAARAQHAKNKNKNEGKNNTKLITLCVCFSIVHKLIR